MEDRFRMCNKNIIYGPCIIWTRDHLEELYRSIVYKFNCDYEGRIELNKMFEAYYNAFLCTLKNNPDNPVFIYPPKFFPKLSWSERLVKYVIKRLEAWLRKKNKQRAKVK